MTSKADYLKKYLSKDEGGGDYGKKKKKVKIKKRSNIVIHDDDVDWRVITPKHDEAGEEDPEDAPIVTEVLDEQAPRWQPFERKGFKPVSEELSPSRRLNDSPGGSPHRAARQHGSPDISPPRKSRRHDSPDNSPPRKSRRHDSPDNSPPRKSRRQATPDISPPRKSRRHDSPDNSPPRKSRRQATPDISPPRKSRRHDSPDNSPPRKSRRQATPDISPPRKSRQQATPDISPPRKSRRRAMPDISPHRKSRRRATPDISPPRKSRRRATPDISPPRRHDSPDISPPRRGLERRTSPVDLSPRSRTSNRSTAPVQPQSKSRWDRYPDQSPPRKSSRWDRSPASQPSRRPPGKGESPDLTPPRKGGRGRTQDVRKPGRKESAPVVKGVRDAEGELLMTSGAHAGLQSAEVLKEENALVRERQAQFYQELDPSTSGRHAETVYRDKSGRRIDLKEEEAKKREEERLKSKDDEKFMAWGRGVAQVRMAHEKVADELYEMSKPLARHADDEDLERMLKERERDGDPMLAFIKKKATKELGSKGGGGKKGKPTYTGSFPSNRFGIRPGYRWDGVNRSNGFEKAWFARQTSKKATADQAYKWSVEDM